MNVIINILLSIVFWIVPIWIFNKYPNFSKKLEETPFCVFVYVVGFIPAIFFTLLSAEQLTKLMPMFAKWLEINGEIAIQITVIITIVIALGVSMYAEFTKRHEVTEE